VYDALSLDNNNVLHGGILLLTVTQLVKELLAFMEPIHSLPFPQQPATRRYPEPVKSSPQPHNLAL